MILTATAILAATWTVSFGGTVALLVCLPIVGIIIGAVLGFFLSQKYFKKQMEENPPMTREGMKALYRSIGRTPSEADINRAMEAFKRQNKTSK